MRVRLTARRASLWLWRKPPRAAVARQGSARQPPPGPAPRAGRRRWTRPPRQWPHRRSRRPRGSQGDGPHPSPCQERALCALSTAVGAPCIAPGCRKGVQRERRQRACGGPGGGGAGALPLGGGRGMEKPAGLSGLQGYQILLAVSVMGLTRDDLYASIGDSVDQAIRLIYAARPKTRKLTL